MIRSLKKGALLGAGLLLAAGPALAAISDHSNIVLKNHAGQIITDLTGTTQLENAYSVKQTCFGTAGCHGDASRTDNAKYSYDDIEKHSYHAQVGANQLYGFNPANPDGDAWETSASPQGKNWVQSAGHMGSW